MKLTLRYPMRPYVKTQGFGESYACINPQTRQVVGKSLGGTCPLGTVDLYTYSGMKGHNGLDMYGASGVPIYATLEGIVDEVETEPSRGLGVGIVSQEKYETTEGEYQIKHRYWHLKSINVTKGQKIEVGTLIGTCDNTGYSSGDHLHYEIKCVENGKNVFQGNGYYGSINPEPYFDGTYANPQFLVDMKLGDKNEEVKRLQQYLKNLGYFTYPECTGYYGNVTREAVFLFQQENIELSWYERYVLKGKTVGPKTRAALNKL